MTGAEPLPPLADVLRKEAEALEEKARSARARKYTHAQIGTKAYAPEAWEHDSDLYGGDAECFRRAEKLAAPYDALIREQALRIEVLQNSARERDAVIEDLEARIAELQSEKKDE